MSYLDLLEMLYASIYVKYGIAFVLCIILAFAEELVLLKHPLVFVILMVLTLAMIYTELFHSPGLTLLLIALTLVSFNMIKTTNKSSSH